jgi:transposase
VYLRHATRRKDGKTHTYWRLVRSVRVGSKVIQETVAHLGELDSEGRAKAKLLARSITGRDSTQRDLFEPELERDQRVTIRLDQIRLENGRTFGNVWLGWTLWRALRLDEACARLLPQGRESVRWSAMAAILVIARLCEPSSELHIAEDWYRKTALEDVLAVPTEEVNDDRLYRALDRLLPHKEAIEQHLKHRLGELFQLDYDLLLYDVTSTYFEGEAALNPQAQRGHSRDHRPDCKQICIALVVTKEGVPLGYEIFDGNRTDITTVEEIVSTMERRFGKSNRIWVMDRGMTSEDNLAWFWQTKRRYLVGTPKAELKKWEQQIVEEKDWRKVREGLEVKLCGGPDGKETFVLCRSEDRQKKEQAMHERFATRIEEGLQSLKRRLDGRKQKEERGRVERQIGRLLQRNSRAAGRFQVDVKEDSTRACGLSLSWSTNAEWQTWATRTEGCYILRTNISDWTAESLWQTYIQLTEAEAAFRVQKSQLSIRPIWHHKKGRVQAHILVCFLAHALWKTLEQWQSRAGLGNSPRTIIDELARIQSADVILPTAESPSRDLRLRCVVRPDAAQQALLDRLGLQLPQRLRPPLAPPTKM